MGLSKLEAIAHPVRLNILLALAQGEKTPQEIAVVLPDVPKATLYRHINALSEVGAILIVRETPVRGAVEKVYAISQPGTNMTAEEMAAISSQEHLRYFAQFTAWLLGQAQTYLSQPNVDVKADFFSYRTELYYLNEAEFAEFREGLRVVGQKAASYAPAPDRKPLQFSLALMPVPNRKAGP